MHNTEVYFTSNVPLLRAHISTIVATPGGGGGVLAVWMFGSCHKWTINFSAQGFGRTAAALVDAGHRANLTVVLGDGEAAWLSHKLPLLNSSVPIGELKDMLVDRRLSLRQVLTRWFKIVEPDVEARVGGRGDAEKGAAVGEADGNASVDEEETDEEADVTTDATNNAAVEAMKTHNAADTAAGEADGNAVADEEAAVEAMEIDKAAGIPAAAEVDVDMDAMDIYTGGELQIPRSP